MNKLQAEEKICELVRVIDAIRVNVSLNDIDKTEKVSLIDSEIKELKVITGQRHITGTISIGG